MNLRILKKLSKKAVPLLAHFGIGPADLFLAERRDNYLGILLMDRSCWDRGRSPHADLIHEREIKRPARDGKGWVYMHPPVHPLKGTPMVGGVDGGEQPEWSEQAAWEMLRGFVRWSDKPTTMTDAEWALAQRITRTKPITQSELDAWLADVEAEAAADLEEMSA